VAPAYAHPALRSPGAGTLRPPWTRWHSWTAWTSRPSRTPWTSRTPWPRRSKWSEDSWGRLCVFPLPVLIVFWQVTLYFEMISNLQKSCKSSTKNFHLPLTVCHICFTSLCLHTHHFFSCTTRGDGTFFASDTGFLQIRAFSYVTLAL
jgi:hypothetical protein